MVDPDHLNATNFSALGDCPVLLVDAVTWTPPAAPIQSVVIGVDIEGTLPAFDPAPFDVLITKSANPPAPWVCASPESIGDLTEWAVPASILCQVLRLGESRAFPDALMLESLAYSALLGGAGFRAWLDGRDEPTLATPPDPVRVARKGDDLTITLNDPANRNAMTARMRDALCEALANALDDPTRPAVSLRASGKCFSTGGALSEFGSHHDLAEAHLVRRLRSAAQLINALGDRIDVHVKGACIGAGIELAAAAARRTATANAWFQLPELRMGLIPGAGGTASLTRAIGRHRTAWLVLSGKRIDARTALNWGLIHEIVA